MRIKISILFTIIFSSSFALNAQSMLGSTVIETLQNNIFNSPKDTTRISLLNTLALEYYKVSKFDSCQFFASQAIKLTDSLLDTEDAKNNTEYFNQIKILKVQAISNIALGFQDSNTHKKVDTLLYTLRLVKETGDKNEEAAIYAILGDVYSFRNQLQLAIENYLLSVDLFRQTDNKSELAMQLTGLAITERYLGNFGDAVEHLIESLELSRQINDSIAMVEALFAMGFTYMYVERWNDALSSHQEAMDICSQMKDSLCIARAYNDMGVINISAGNLDIALQDHQAALNIRLNSTDYFYTSASYSYIGSIYEQKAMLPEAIKNYKESLRYAEVAGFNIGIISSNIDVGNLYLKFNDYEKALKHFNAALDLSQENDDQIAQAMASMKIAEIYLAQNNNRKALSWLQKAENSVPKTAFIYLGEIYKSIAQAYFQLGDYKNAYSNAMIYSQVKDSLVVAQNLEKITTLTNRLEFENKQALQNESHVKMMQIKQKEIERQRVVKNFSLFGAFVILVLAIIYFVRFIEKNKLNTALKKTLSNLKSAQVQLVHAEKMASLGELTAGVAHEIQNPLNFINNFSELNTELIEEIKEEWKKGNHEEVKALLDDIVINETKINQHGKRAETIVKGMLQHSRISAGETEPTNINSLADEYLRLAYHGLRAKDKSFNAQFETQFDDSLPRINLIPPDIGRVLLNLINNAFYAVSERAKQNEQNYKPSVKVSTKKLDDKIEIKVQDNGGGIPEKIKEKIFQPFFTTKASGEGTGLGLSISYDIITKGHDGELKVETTEGEGACFIISLPIK